MSSVQEYLIESTLSYVDGPLIYTVLEHPTTEQGAKAYIALVKQVHKEHGQVFLLVDNQKNQAVEPGARRQFYELAKEKVVTASATIGGGVGYRTMMNLIVRALSLIRVSVGPNGFFSTEVQARAWLEEQRIAAAKKKSSGAGF